MPAQNLEKQSEHVLKVMNMVPSIPSNNSHEQLMPPGGEDQQQPADGTFRSVSKREWITIVILFYVNLINYMDRFTLAGILTDVQLHYNIGNDEGGLLQTSFILSYMIFAPLFGYLGDRYSRKWLMTAGVLLWSVTTLMGSFMNNFGWFIFFRAMVGIGEASYSTIAPTIISDLFVHNIRSKMLAFFYFAIPVGSGLGYIVGSKTAQLLGQWQYALRVTPVLGLIAVLLLAFVSQDPVRGQSEGSESLKADSLKKDIVELVKNRSFMLSTVGSTCVAFVAGALAWWGPKMMELGIEQQGASKAEIERVSFIFGVVAMLAGVTGVPLGSFLAQRLRPRYSRIDPHICAAGLIISSPMIFGALMLAPKSGPWCYLFVFLGQVSLNMTWSIVADILLYVVLPTRRSTAEGMQLLISHALGDAGSPYLIGIISEVIKPHLNSSTISSSVTDRESTINFYSLQYALFITCFVEVLGGIFFLLNAFYIVEDRKRVDDTIKEASSVPNVSNDTISTTRTSL